MREAGDGPRVVGVGIRDAGPHAWNAPDQRLHEETERRPTEAAVAAVGPADQEIDARYPRLSDLPRLGRIRGGDVGLDFADWPAVDLDYEAPGRARYSGVLVEHALRPGSAERLRVA